MDTPDDAGLRHAEVVRPLMKTVWPAVQAGIAEQVRRAGTQNLKGFNRRITEQALWVLSRADQLLTPEHTKVIEAARTWAEIVDDEHATPSRLDDADDALLRAVQELP